MLQNYRCSVDPTIPRNGDFLSPYIHFYNDNVFRYSHADRYKDASAYSQLDLHGTHTPMDFVSYVIANGERHAISWGNYWTWGPIEV